MSTTLYLLRRPLHHISPSLFRANEADTSVVLLEQAASVSPSFGEGDAVIGEGVEVTKSGRTLTYEDLVERVFSSEHVIVI